MHDSGDQAADAVAGVARAFEDLFNLLTVREADGRSGGVGRQLMGEVAGDGLFFVQQQQFFKIADILKRRTVGERTGGIHRQSVVEGEALTGKADAGFGFDVFGKGAIAVAPAAHDVEAFERKTGRIDLTMAGSTTDVRAVAITRRPPEPSAARSVRSRVDLYFARGSVIKYAARAGSKKGEIELAVLLSACDHLGFELRRPNPEPLFGSTSSAPERVLTVTIDDWIYFTGLPCPFWPLISTE